jgi:hypothetical protein
MVACVLVLVGRFVDHRGLLV